METLFTLFTVALSIGFLLGHPTGPGESRSENIIVLYTFDKSPCPILEAFPPENKLALEKCNSYHKQFTDELNLFLPKRSKRGFAESFIANYWASSNSNPFEWSLSNYDVNQFDQFETNQRRAQEKANDYEAKLIKMKKQLEKQIEQLRLQSSHGQLKMTLQSMASDLVERFKVKIETKTMMLNEVRHQWINGKVDHRLFEIFNFSSSEYCQLNNCQVELMQPVKVENPVSDLFKFYFKIHSDRSSQKSSPVSVQLSSPTTIVLTTVTSAIFLIGCVLLAALKYRKSIKESKDDSQLPNDPVAIKPVVTRLNNLNIK